jgi:Domain of unknown function (DUF5597)/Beta-galactosidase
MRKVIVGMRSHLTSAVTLLTVLVSLGPVSVNAAQAGSQGTQPPARKRELRVPHLRKVRNATQMIVDGRPYLMLAGELHNSTASSASFMEPIWPKLAGLHLNTVISTVSWELIEPIEGRFDFTSVDSQIRSAQQHGLHLVLIWFATWKNASDSYVPMWVKKDQQRFPPALVHGPGTFMGMRMSSLSSLGENTIAADAKAFATLMRHLREFDTRHTVIMMQVENETGLLGDSRDRSALAEAAWSKPVPSELMNYLSEHKSSLLPELAAIWQVHGFKTSGTWAEVFGTEPAADEVFMAWFIGSAVGRVAEAGKAELPIPMYVNAWLGPQPGQKVPGQYPSGGPVAGMLDVWRAAAPKLDFFSPDIYVADFQGVCNLYVRSGNPLFIPEARTNVANLFWAVSHESALGYSPFGIEDVVDFKPLASAYATLGELAPMILTYAPEGKVMAVIEGNQPSVKHFQETTGLAIKFGGLQSLFSSGHKDQDPQKDLPPAPTGDMQSFTTPEPDKRGFALVIQTAPDAFIIAGSNVLLTNSDRLLGTVDEGSFRRSEWVPGRRLNGDETFSGNFALLGSETINILRVTTYTPE